MFIRFIRERAEFLLRLRLFAPWRASEGAGTGRLGQFSYERDDRVGVRERPAFSSGLRSDRASSENA